jgi:hypothetical protein
MDYGSVTKTILELAAKSTVLESTIKIPPGDNNNSPLDISSAARGELLLPLMERPSSQKGTLLDHSICLVLICTKKIHGKK